MKNNALLWLISASAFALAACTQEPANVVYKGNDYFGREHEAVVNSPDNETFDVDAPRYKRGYARPVEDAAVTSVGVSDLPPPSQSGPKSTMVESHDLTPADKKITSNGQTHYLNQEPARSNASVEVQQDQPVEDVPVHKAAADAKGSSKFIWPVDGGKIISHFDTSAKAGAKANDGINIGMSEGEPIFAAADGVVVYAGSELQGYGNMVILRHDGGWMSAYAHARSLAVKKGEKVKQSDLIAYVGATGGVKTPQVHFVLRKDKTPVDPEKYLPHTGK